MYFWLKKQTSCILVFIIPDNRVLCETRVMSPTHASYLARFVASVLQFLGTAEGAWGVTLGLLGAVLLKKWGFNTGGLCAHRDQPRERLEEKEGSSEDDDYYVNSPRALEQYRQQQQELQGADPRALRRVTRCIPSPKVVLARRRGSRSSSYASSSVSSTPEFAARTTGRRPASVPGFGSWHLTEEEQIERELVFADKWADIVQRALEDNVFGEHAAAVDDRRRTWNRMGGILRKHGWAVDNRVKTRVKIVKVGRITKWRHAVM
jgi:hypothetical protein